MLKFYNFFKINFYCINKYYCIIKIYEFVKEN